MSQAFVVFFSMILTVVGCDQLPISKKKDNSDKNGQPARITLKLSNSTDSLNITANARGCTSAGSAGDLNCYTPLNYEVKILHAYLLSSDATPSYQDSGLIWANPTCNVTPKNFDVLAKNYELSVLETPCTEDNANTLIDLAQDSSTILTNFGSKEYQIAPGIYDRLKISYCYNNGRFKTADMADSKTITANSCVYSSLSLIQKVELKEGESLTLDVQYTLKGVIQDKAPSAYVNSAETVCRVDGEIQRCLGESPLMLPPMN